jgi:hypothetical protein
VTRNQDDYLRCVEAACTALDEIQEYGIAEGDAAALLVMHGLAMYARDTARASAALLRAGQTLGAAALTRIVIEHAVLAQRIQQDPDERAQLVLQQSVVEQFRWFEVVVAADLDKDDEGQPWMTAPEELRGPKPKNVAREFETVKNLFGDGQGGRQLYLTYRNLSRFVHPSASTFGRYTIALPFGLQLVNQVQEPQDPESAAFFLGSATVMCALPYLDLVGADGSSMRLRGAARTIGVLTDLDD